MNTQLCLCYLCISFILPDLQWINWFLYINKLAMLGNKTTEKRQVFLSCISPSYT